MNSSAKVSDRGKGGCLALLIKAGAIVLAAAFILYGIALFGIGLGMVIGGLLYYSPHFRAWWCSRRLYQRRLSGLPGMSSDSVGSLAIATAVYASLGSVVGWWLAGTVVMEELATSNFGTTLAMGAVGIIVAFILLHVSGELQSEPSQGESATDSTMMVGSGSGDQTEASDIDRGQPPAPEIASLPSEGFPTAAVAADIRGNPRSLAVIAAAVVTTLICATLAAGLSPRRSAPVAPSGSAVVVPTPLSVNATPASADPTVFPDSSEPPPTAPPAPTQPPPTSVPSRCVTPDQKYVNEVLGGAIQAGVTLTDVQAMPVEIPGGSQHQWFLIGGRLVANDDGSDVGFPVWINDIDPSGQSGYSGLMYAAEAVAESFSVYPRLAMEFRPSSSDLRAVVECVKQ